MPDRRRPMKLALCVLACIALYALVTWVIVKNYQGL
jgi:hypothetical protein